MAGGVMKRIEEIAVEYYPEQGHHGFDHPLRVRGLAVRIGKEEGADLEIVEAAALLHDIGRAKEDAGEIGCHAEFGAGEAKKVLEKAGFPEEKREKVRYCIAVHRASKGMEAETLEAQILQDADRLELLGAIGVGRAFHRAGVLKLETYDPKQPTDVEYVGQVLPVINHLMVKSLKFAKPSSFNTKTAQKIAEKKHGFLKEFIERFVAEWNGKE